MINFATFRTLSVLGTFGVVTYFVLNWLLDLSWNWELIGRLTVAIFSSLGAILIGGVASHALLSLLRRTRLVSDIADY